VPTIYLHILIELLAQFGAASCEVNPLSNP
jgi:hypothetical protein